MAVRKGIRRVKPSPLSDDKPKVPIDTSDPWPKKKEDFTNRFAAIIDPVILLSDEAIRRIDKSIRLAVLAEVAQLDYQGDIVIRQIGGRGTDGIWLMAKPPARG